MALPLLLPLLASLQSLPRPVSPAALLPAPTLSRYPSYTVYFPGERVTLTCTTPWYLRFSQYRFFYQKGPLGPSTVLSPNAGAQLELTAGKGSAGSYTCAYWRWKSNRQISSENSSSVPITVAAPLPAPQLTVSPHQPVYIMGETVNLTCSAAGAPTVSGIRFFKDIQEICSPGLPSAWHSYTHSLTLPGVSGSQAGAYSCAYWKDESGREMPSERSRPISIAVTAPPPAPSLSLDPLHPIYSRGEPVALRCSAPQAEQVAEYRFFNQRGEQISTGVSSPGTWLLSMTDAADRQVYSCLYRRVERGREIPSEMSHPVSVSVTDPPPQPVLSVDPPLGAVSEGLPLLLTCAATRAAREQRFHFYKDGTEIVPGDLESEISTSEPSTSSVNVSVLSIPRAGPNNSGEFTCGYEENVNGRWLLSPKSQAVTITVTASHHIRDTLLTTAGVLLVAGGLAALICCCRRKKKVPKPLKSTEESEAEEHTRNLDASRDNEEAKAMSAGEQQMEQDSEVTYAVIAPAALKAHITLSKTKSKPDEEEHVLYSEVATKHTWKATK